MILDINLPDGDGVSLFRTLVARSRCVDPVPLCTGRRCRPGLFRLGLGADDYLTKPFLMQELLFAGAAPCSVLTGPSFPGPKAAILQLGDRRNLHDALVTLRTETTFTLTATRRTLFMQSWRKPRAYRILRCAVRERCGRGLLAVWENSLVFISGICWKSWNPEPGRPASADGEGHSKLAKEDV